MTCGNEEHAEFMELLEGIMSLPGRGVGCVVRGNPFQNKSILNIPQEPFKSIELTTHQNRHIEFDPHLNDNYKVDYVEWYVRGLPNTDEPYPLGQGYAPSIQAAYDMAFAVVSPWEEQEISCLAEEGVKIVEEYMTHEQALEAQPFHAIPIRGKDGNTYWCKDVFECKQGFSYEACECLALEKMGPSALDVAVGIEEVSIRDTAVVEMVVPLD